jgi:hypothetical protein
MTIAIRFRRYVHILFFYVKLTIFIFFKPVLLIKDYKTFTFKIYYLFYF